MLRLWGVPVLEGDAHRLVATLIADATPAALSAAHAIGHGLDQGSALIALTPEQRDAILAVLENPPPGGLSELRGELTKDRRERMNG
jgi:hypothetical protein